MFSTCFAASLVALRLLSIERVPACFACLQQEFEVVRQESLGTVISLVPVVHFNVLKCRGKHAVGRELSWDTMKTVRDSMWFECQVCLFVHAEMSSESASGSASSERDKRSLFFSCFFFFFFPIFSFWSAYRLSWTPPK